MYCRGFDPGGHADTLYSLASILLFAWLLGATGVYQPGLVGYALLGVATVMLAVATFGRRV